MSFPEKWLRSQLGSATTAGIHPVLASQNAPYPLVVYRRVSTTRERGLGGNFGVPVAVFSLSIVSESYSEVKSIADQIRVALDNFTGEAAGAKIVLSSLTTESDSMERPRDGQAKPLYRVDQSYEVRFQETT